MLAAACGCLLAPTNLGCDSKTASIVVNNSERNMDYISRKLDDMDCNVYFFRSFGGHSHPIGLVEAVTYEEAIQRSYCRGWMCFRDNKKEYALMEAMRVTRIPFVDGVPPLQEQNSPLEFYALEKSESGFRVRARISADQSANETDFLEVKQANGVRTATIVSRVTALSYRYFYGPTGALSKAELRNMYGDYTVLE